MAAQSGSKLSVATGLLVPIEGKPAVYEPGYGGEARLYFSSKPEAVLKFGLDLGYSYLPLRISDSASLVEAGGLGALCFPLGSRTELHLDLAAGASAGILNSAMAGSYEGSSGAPWGMSGYGGLDLGFDWYLRPDFALAADLGYRYASGLYQGFRASLGAAFHIPSSSAQTDVIGIEVAPILPAFRAYYLENPGLRVDLRNGERFRAEGLSARVVAGSLNAGGPWSQALSLDAGETGSLYVSVPWTRAILDRAAPSSEPLHLEIAYTAGGKRRTIDRSANCLVLGRNGFIWQRSRAGTRAGDALLDRVLLAADGKAATLVDPSDPNFISLANDLSAVARTSLGYDRLSTEFRSIIEVTSYLRSRSLRYQVDPDSVPYGPAGEDRVDFLRFPSETLGCGYGDCDDLSILFASLLEASGVPTAFVTVPGHIYVAADCGLDRISVISLFGSTARFIEAEGRCWLPIEVTAVGKGMSFCWDTGIEEWRSAKATERGIFVLGEQWKEFKPSSLPWSLPVSEFLSGEGYRAALIEDREAVAESALGAARAGASGRIPNLSDERKAKEYARLAFLELSFGRLEAASEDMREALALAPAYSHYYNAGLVAFHRGRLEEAAAFLAKAVELRDTAPARALLAAAQGSIISGALASEATRVAGAGRSSEAAAEFPWDGEL